MGHSRPSALTDSAAGSVVIPRWVMPVLIGAGALFRLLHYFDRESLWGDEAMLAVSLVGRSFHGLLWPLDYDQLAPIPFLWATRAMVQLGGANELALRVVPLLAGIAMLVVLARFAGRLLNPLGAVVAVGLAAFSTILIRYSAELKPYSLDALMALVVGWYALDLLERLDDRSRWLRFGVAGLLGVVVSTSAVFVCCGAAACVGTELLLQRRPRLLAPLAICGVIWLAAFFTGLRLVYGRVANAEYIRDFWQAGFLNTATPALALRTGLAVKETLLPVADWMVAFGLGIPPLLVAIGGAVAIARRRGAGPVMLLTVPTIAAFVASALSFYPIAIRVMIYAAPFLTVLVAAGIVRIAEWIHARVPSTRVAVAAIAFLIPSFEIAVRTRIIAPRDEEIRPIVQALRQQNRPGAAYVFHRTLPAWAFYTTNWANPDTDRVRWMEQSSNGGGLVHENGKSRGPRPLGEGADLRRDYEGHLELLGVSSGVRGRHWLGYDPDKPDLNWAENEASRIRDAASPGIWIVFDDAIHGGEGTSLMSAVRAAGGVVSDSVTSPGAIAYWATFPAGR